MLTFFNKHVQIHHRSTEAHLNEHSQQLKTQISSGQLVHMVDENTHCKCNVAIHLNIHLLQFEQLQNEVICSKRAQNSPTGIWFNVQECAGVPSLPGQSKFPEFSLISKQFSLTFW